MIMSIINMNNSGIKTVDNLPIPLSMSLYDTNQKITHKINVQVSVGIMNDVALDKFALPPTLFVKKEAGLSPHPKLKLFSKYTKSQPKITM